MSLDLFIAQRDFKGAWDLIVNEIEAEPDSKEEHKELFTFVLTTYW